MQNKTKMFSNGYHNAENSLILSAGDELVKLIHNISVKKCPNCKTIDFSGFEEDIKETNKSNYAFKFSK